MSSTFGGLNTARTALWASQRGLDVTGQNIANVNTDGYSRQRVELRAMGGTAVPAIHSVSSPVGNGVDANQVDRIRDVFLERRGQVETARTAQLTVGNEALAQVEAAFREPGETGIRSMLDDVWAGFSALANATDPTEPAVRSQVLERLDILASGMRTTRATLDQQWRQTRDNVVALAAEVNTTASSIADLNTQIRQATRSGLPTNELSDRRDLLVVQLAEKVGATSVAASDGMVDVIVGGTTLVAGGSALGLRVAGVDDPDAVGAGNDPRVVTAPGGTTLAVGGTAGGQMAVLSTTLPSYRNALDGLARDLVGKINAVQAQGYDVYGASGAAEPLMDDGSGNPVVDLANVDAGNIRVRVTRPELIAAATTAPGVLGAPSADGGNADAFFDLSLENGGVDATYRALVVALGVEASVVARDVAVQKVISTQVDAARESVSGVNLDEEMTNMLSFQHAYSAAARMVTAIDEALDTLINRTGVVGR
ncbi:flagellar hook-associated protein FlgK [Geodermatophilus obscurus]|uniref:Flagellar hook-associated protein 1 n=1 Tax=Geodermatophilus obscurus (strain ATCC 25078 / DSM 43160 / JCM 3152 / CCUG 61914 / KCC A-0152 / KCTC 9177 / NBRC 13315 / NRRL B-3577 / G-20) TaxID=526225 RepID=D2S9N7_GEOOG|nr:flagellar hook-associated protein FlgK [Geodermatophilus obscurus]ADB73750.1 flagellar hook-associated protein FlgK [Geodermatophilus obscurus DSM 43160]